MLHNSPNLETLTPEDPECSLPKRPAKSAQKYGRFFRYLPPTVLSLLAIIFFFCTSFIIFSEKTGRLKPPNPLPPADAIIVLTGGENRIETGLNLLQQGVGSRLLISGVNIIANPDRFTRAARINPQLSVCCVDIGREAANTRGNAEESAAWIKKHGYKTVYIVTHDYHMWRSLLELKHLMPDVNFIAYPVKKNNAESLIQQINYIRILASEYIKIINVYIRHIF
ncbi:putative membrane protein [Bartonella australis AUST/NH1]|uniref:Putative membrane protein n=1 Tax=Bartonella australis (strain Aust/NH1) TaxID=1094489 RepID=M1P5E0_BARAA|nr:YdcF family protein [Bartonella australis]AGF75055.1 putative membrane protein [Bartonella australis AUST/NH1]